MNNTLTNVPGLKALKDELALVEEKVVLGYTLADAMREGARHTAQAKKTYIVADSNQVCALAAASLAVKARYGG